MEAGQKEAAMGAGRYDVIVVGARVAGAATAMLLARQGLRVLAVDRVSFPRDTISSHQLQVPGVALLHPWGPFGMLTGARQYRERPVRSFASYSYWAGVPVSGGELYQRPGRAVAVFPTNDELTMVYAAAPMTEFASARADLEGHYLRTLDLCGDLGERARSGNRAERLRTTPDQPNTFRCSHGPGWALAGDAGVVMDSISAQGMTSALRDASHLSAAVVAGLGGRRPLASTLHDHQRRRDRAIRGIYDFTLGLGAFPPAGPGQRHFL